MRYLFFYSLGGTLPVDDRHRTARTASDGTPAVGSDPTWKAAGAASMDDRPDDRQESRERRPSRPRQEAGEGMAKGVSDRRGEGEAEDGERKNG